MFFAINTSGNVGITIGKSLSLLIKTPDPYIGTDIQVKILRQHAFEVFKKRHECQFENQVSYTGHEVIPDVPKTEKMKADIEIEGAKWI